MLFDIEDYINAGIIGPASATNDVKELDWAMAYVTYTATSSAHVKATFEYYDSGMRVNSFDTRAAIYAAYTEWYTKYTEFTNNEALTFWGAMLSLNPDVTDQATFAAEYPSYPELRYTVFSPAIYEVYKARMTSLMSALKNLTVVIDGSTYMAVVD